MYSQPMHHNQQPPHVHQQHQQSSRQPQQTMMDQYYYAAPHSQQQPQQQQQYHNAPVPSYGSMEYYQLPYGTSNNDAWSALMMDPQQQHQYQMHMHMLYQQQLQQQQQQQHIQHHHQHQQAPLMSHGNFVGMDKKSTPITSPGSNMGLPSSMSSMGAPCNTPASCRARFTLILNVPPTTTRPALLASFSTFGQVDLAVVACATEDRHPFKEWTASTGIAFVRFAREADALTALREVDEGKVRINAVKVRGAWAKADTHLRHQKPPRVSKNNNNTSKQQQQQHQHQQQHQRNNVVNGPGLGTPAVAVALATPMGQMGELKNDIDVKPVSSPTVSSVSSTYGKVEAFSHAPSRSLGNASTVCTNNHVNHNHHLSPQQAHSSVMNMNNVMANSQSTVVIHPHSSQKLSHRSQPSVQSVSPHSARPSTMVPQMVVDQDLDQDFEQLYNQMHLNDD